jgi:lipopolysaccharide transport system permease protein
LIPGLILLTVNLGWVVVILAVAAARFRDIVPIVNSLVTIGFFVTPVMWSPNLIAGNQASQLLLGLNPLFHWIQIVRLPILGEFPTAENWTAASIVAVVGWVSAFFIQKRFRHMIPYWV